MEENLQNEKLQTRREFFRQAAKGVLPILGAAVLASAPALVRATEKQPMGCLYGCNIGCSGTCAGGCSGDCFRGCSGGCDSTCTGGCTGTCKGTCTGSCSGSCSGGSTARVW